MAKVPSSIRKISMNIMYFTCYNQIYKKWHGFLYLYSYGYQCNDEMIWYSHTQQVWIDRILCYCWFFLFYHCGNNTILYWNTLGYGKGTIYCKYQCKCFTMNWKTIHWAPILILVLPFVYIPMHHKMIW